MTQYQDKKGTRSVSSAFVIGSMLICAVAQWSMKQNLIYPTMMGPTLLSKLENVLCRKSVILANLHHLGAMIRRKSTTFVPTAPDQAQNRPYIALTSPLARKIQISGYHSPPRSWIEKPRGHSSPIDGDHFIDGFDVRVVKDQILRETLDIDHTLLAIAVVL